MQGSSAEVEQQTLFGQYQAVMESTFQKQQQQYWTDGPMFTLQELAEQLEGQDNCNEEVRTDRGHWTLFMSDKVSNRLCIP